MLKGLAEGAQATSDLAVDRGKWGISARGAFASGGLLMVGGAPGRTRTRNPWVRSPVLYPLSYRRAMAGNLRVMNSGPSVRVR